MQNGWGESGECVRAVRSLRLALCRSFPTVGRGTQLAAARLCSADWRALDWYVAAKATRSPRWFGPYSLDDEFVRRRQLPAEAVAGRDALGATFAVPLFNPQNTSELLGVFAADLSLAAVSAGLRTALPGLERAAALVADTRTGLLVAASEGAVTEARGDAVLPIAATQSPIEQLRSLAVFLSNLPGGLVSLEGGGVSAACQGASPPSLSLSSHPLCPRRFAVCRAPSPRRCARPRRWRCQWGAAPAPRSSGCWPC
jgi:hypothetical protein